MFDFVNKCKLHDSKEFLESEGEKYLSVLNKIRNYISKSYATWLKGEFKEKIPNNIGEFSRSNLTRNLANILKMKVYYA